MELLCGPRSEPGSSIRWGEYPPECHSDDLRFSVPEIKTLERSLGSKIDTIDRSVGRLDEKVLRLSSPRT